MDNVIDKLLLEWSWRCEKGYPDINNPADKKVLDKLLAEYGITLGSIKKKLQEQEEESITIDTLIDLIKSRKDSFDQDFINRLYKSIKTKGMKISTKIVKFLQDKQIDKAKSIILTAAERAGIEEELLTYLEQNEDTKISISDLVSKSGSNFLQFLSEKTKLPINFLETVSGGDAPIGSKGVGAAEYVLALLGKNASKQIVGDVELDGKSIEVKADKARLGERSGNLDNLYSEIENTFNLEPRSVKSGKENLVDYISNVVSNLESKEDIQTLRTLVSREFDNYLSEVDIQNMSEVRKTLYSWYVDNFYETEPSDLILLYLKGKFKIYTKEEFKDDVLNGKIIFSNTFGKSNKAPQLLDFT
jgi:hypothetical protein